MSQSINLADIKNVTFNGTAIKIINLDGVEIWSGSIEGDSLSLESQIYPSVPGGYRFGSSVAVSDNRIVVGTYDGQQSGVVGSIYIYDINGTQLHHITSPGGINGDQFGTQVAVSDTSILISAPRDNNIGAAYLYSIDGVYQAKLVPPDGSAYDNFGSFTIAISNTVIAIGAPDHDTPYQSSGALYLYSTSGSFLTKITAHDTQVFDRFGNNVAASDTRIVVSALGDDDLGDTAGAAYLYNINGSFIKKITAYDGQANDVFGAPVAISDTVIAIGAPSREHPTQRGAVYIYDVDGTLITKVIAYDIEDYDNFGSSISVSDSLIAIGSRADDDNGVLSSGSVYLYDTSGVFLAKITATNSAQGDWFGHPVGVSDRALVAGSYKHNGQTGTIYIYK